MRHELKTREKYFSSLWSGTKTFEIRKNDRNFLLDDQVVLQEWDRGGYTGREIEGFITYITDFEQKPDFVVFSFREYMRSE